jgi:hypothetical protein
MRAGVPAERIEVTGNADKLGDFRRVLEPFGIRELDSFDDAVIGARDDGEPFADPIDRLMVM